MEYLTIIFIIGENHKQTPQLHYFKKSERVAIMYFRVAG